MFSHVMVGANDLEATRKFYDAVLGTLGIAPGVINKDIRYFYRTPTGTFSFTKPIDGQPATPANGGTIGFLAESLEQVHAFHAAGIANGGTTCEDPPGPRDGAFGILNLAYLRDPTGNKICVLHRQAK
jgi:catechol 2,3-dioxygenase-like lactoylglutathione lyase family enzyme